MVQGVGAGDCQNGRNRVGVGYESLGLPIQTGRRSPDSISGDVLPVLGITAMVIHFDFGYCSPMSFRFGFPFTMGQWITPLFYVCGWGLDVLFECPIRSESFSAMKDSFLPRGMIMRNMLVETGFTMWSPMCYVHGRVMDMQIWSGSL